MDTLEVCSEEKGVAAMIHVTPQPEPEDFDRTVRQKGLTWLQNNGIDLNSPLPVGTKIYSYWTKCLHSLYTAYGGYCAYLAIFLDKSTGSCTVEHFVPKSQRPDLAYEWSNYRLSCRQINSRKLNFNDVLDPFEVEDGWFQLELVSGHIFPNPHLSDNLIKRVKNTIDRLGLDNSDNKEMRAMRYLYYCKGLVTDEYLKLDSPFVWMEAKRQGLL